LPGFPYPIPSKTQQRLSNIDTNPFQALKEELTDLDVEVSDAIMRQSGLDKDQLGQLGETPTVGRNPEPPEPPVAAPETAEQDTVPGSPSILAPIVDVPSTWAVDTCIDLDSDVEVQSNGTLWYDGVTTPKTGLTLSSPVSRQTSNYRLVVAGG
jgi:hypothetical protein